jgi:uncharacterized protein YgiM (DUF1202 family)
MFKLIAVTCAALYAILLIFGDETRRPAEVARAEPQGLSVVTPAALTTLERTPVPTTDISEREAVQLAIAAGKAIREERRNAGPKTIAVAATGAVDGVSAPELSYWYVTGSRVNLRGGPGTANAVVGQATFGAEAEVLSDSNGWYQIRLADGSATGWIFGKFLNEKLPG